MFNLESANYAGFIAFVKSQDKAKVIDSHMGWDQCAVGDYLRSLGLLEEGGSYGFFSETYEAINKWTQSELEVNNPELYGMLVMPSEARSKASTYGGLQDFIEALDVLELEKAPEPVQEATSEAVKPSYEGFVAFVFAQPEDLVIEHDSLRNCAIGLYINSVLDSPQDKDLLDFATNELSHPNGGLIRKLNMRDIAREEMPTYGHIQRYMMENPKPT